MLQRLNYWLEKLQTVRNDPQYKRKHVEEIQRYVGRMFDAMMLPLHGHMKSSEEWISKHYYRYLETINIIRKEYWNPSEIKNTRKFLKNFPQVKILIDQIPIPDDSEEDPFTYEEKLEYIISPEAKLHDKKPSSSSSNMIAREITAHDLGLGEEYVAKKIKPIYRT